MAQPNGGGTDKGVIGEMAALGCAFTWALTSILIKQPVIRMGAVSVNTLRTWTGAAVFLALLLATGKAGALLALPPYTVFALVFSMAIGLGIGDTLYFQSVKLIGVSRALPISGSYPLPTLLLAVIWLGEPVTWRHALGTMLVVTSIYLISLPSGKNGVATAAQRDIRRGVLLAALAGVLWATSTALLKSGVGNTDLVVANSVRLPAAGLVLLSMVLRQPGGFRVRGVEAGTVAVVLLSGIAGTALGSALYLTAVIQAGAAKAAALQSVSPFIAAPLAFVFLREPIAPATLAGTVLSVAGVWLLLGM